MHEQKCKEVLEEAMHLSGRKRHKVRRVSARALRPGQGWQLAVERGHGWGRVNLEKREKMTLRRHTRVRGRKHYETRCCIL